jgi:hypothetical protein
MEQNKEEKKWAPPYIAYKTFLNFLEKLKAAGIPTKIDRSVVPSWSGAIQGHLFSSLKFLHLMSQHGIPTERLSNLVNAEEADRQRILKDILVTSYKFLFENGVNLQRITSDEFRKLFDKEGVSGGTLPKAMKFFVEASKDAGMELSPYIGKFKGTSSRSTGSRTKKIDGERQPPSSPAVPPYGKQPEKNLSWQQIYLSKMPDFDPAWSEEIKTKWFDGMNKVLEELKKQ